MAPAPIPGVLALGRRALASLAGPVRTRLSNSRGKVDPRAEAEKTALTLLREVLGAGASQMTQRGYLEIRSTVFDGVVYRLRMRQPIEVCDRGGLRPVGRLCVVVKASVPAADELLAKALWLQTNEVRLLKVGQRLA